MIVIKCPTSSNGEHRWEKLTEADNERPSIFKCLDCHTRMYASELFQFELAKDQLGFQKWLSLTAVIISVVALLASVFVVNYQNNSSSTHVKRAIFDECFQYYSTTQQEEGISKELVATCWDKANDWTKEVINYLAREPKLLVRLGGDKIVPPRGLRNFG